MTLTRKKILKTILVILALLVIFFIGMTYTRYRDLKKTFLEKISHKATVLFGQSVTIGNFSFSPGGEMNLHDIVVNNPQGFESGLLLRVKRLALGLRWRELVGGRFSFRDIEVSSPELTLITGEKGGMNVSDELKRFLSKKGTTKYQIDEFRIRSGTVSLDNSLMTMGRDIDLSMKNLSSREDAKTLIGVTLKYAGNPVKVEGWAYPNSSARNFNLSLFSEDFSFSAFGDTLGKYAADIGKVRAALKLNAEGDAVKGYKVTSRVQLKMRDRKDVLLGVAEFSAEGTLSRGFTGKASFEIERMTYADHVIPRLAGTLNIGYRESRALIRDLQIDSEEGKMSVGSLNVQMTREKSAYGVEMKGVAAFYPAKEFRIRSTALMLNLRTGDNTMSGDLALSSAEITYQGIPVKVKSGNLRFDGREFSLFVPVAEIAGGRATLRAKARVSKLPFPVETEMSAEGIDLGVLSRAPEFSKLPYGISGTLSHILFKGTMDSPVSFDGKIVTEAKNLSFVKRDSNQTVLKGVGLSAETLCGGRDCRFGVNADAGSMRAAVSGEIKRFAEMQRVITLKVLLPETQLTVIRTSLWDAFPDGLLYSGLKGSLSSDVAVEYSGERITAGGSIRLADVFVEGENGEYSVGPVNGILPFRYDTAKHIQAVAGIPSFEPSEFETLNRHYSREPLDDGYQGISIGSFRYGFRILDTVDVRVRPSENGLNVGRLSANMFGGKLNGSALVDFSDGVTYRAGVLLKGLSLARLCEEIEPVKGYISGKVDGTATIKGSGAGVSRLIGKADFWSYSSGGEVTKISKEFLHKIGGPSLKAYLGDRNFDKGVMGLYLQNGFVIFRELEISHRNMLGVTDLSVKVAPFNNRIEINHLLWTVTEAAQRAGDKQ